MLLLSFVLWVAPSLTAQRTAACEGSSYHELDYLRGRWQSTWVAKKVDVGRYSIESAADGCALVMKWAGAPSFPGNGTGLLSYDAALGKWHYIYVGEDASISMLTGRTYGDSTLFEGSKNDPRAPQSKLTVRLTFKRGDGATIVETWQLSRDGGKTWVPFGQFRLSHSE